MKVVNLSRRRFVNVRPVTRATIALWVLGAALLATNLYSFLQYWIDSVEIRSQREQTLGLIRQQRDAIRGLQQHFDQLDLPVENRKVEFLNTLINARTFPWSQLFDDLEEVLIPDARVTSVQPRIEIETEQRPTRRLPVPARSTRSRRARAQAQTAEEKDEAESKPSVEPEPEHREVQLALRGYVKDDQALADLVDAFFDDPSFQRPYLAGESVDPSNGLSFSLEVTYLLPINPPATNQLVAESVAGGPPPGATGPPTAAGGAGAPVAPDTREGSAAVAESSGKPAAESPRSEPATSPAGTRPSARPSRRPPEVPPRAAAVEAPGAGTPAAGTPAAGTPGAGTPGAGAPAGALVVAPQVRGRAAPLRPAGVPSSPANPPRPVAPDSPRTPPPPPVRPRFVGPEATGTPRVTGGGGSR